MKRSRVKRAFTLRPSAQPIHSLHRLNALVDGIYAIAATLLVLELHPPVAAPGRLGSELLHQWPEYCVYALGFLQIVAAWTVERRWGSWCRGVDHYATLLVLGTVAFYSLTPFTTSVLARAARNEEDLGSAVRLMAVVVFLSMAMFTIATVYLQRRKLFREDLEPAGFQAAMRITYSSTLWPALAFLLSFASPQLALAAIVLLYVIALLPVEALTTEQYACE